MNFDSIFGSFICAYAVFIIVMIICRYLATISALGIALLLYVCICSAF